MCWQEHPTCNGIYASNVQWVAARLPLLVHFCQHILCCQSKEVNCLHFQCIFVSFVWYIFNLEPLYIQPFLIFLNCLVIFFFSFCVSNQLATTPTICISILLLALLNTWRLCSNYEFWGCCTRSCMLEMIFTFFLCIIDCVCVYLTVQKGVITKPSPPYPGSGWSLLIPTHSSPRSSAGSAILVFAVCQTVTHPPAYTYGFTCTN